MEYIVAGASVLFMGFCFIKILQAADKVDRVLDEIRGVNRK